MVNRDRVKLSKIALITIKMLSKQ